LSNAILGFNQDITTNIIINKLNIKIYRSSVNNFNVSIIQQYNAVDQGIYNSTKIGF